MTGKIHAPRRARSPTARDRRYRRSLELLELGPRWVPGASSSSARVSGFDPVPPFLVRGRGPHVWDVDGHRYLDLNLGYGALLHGHAPKALVRAVMEQAGRGLHLAAPNELELQVARRFLGLVRTAERVAFCGSGTDATFNAVRLARHTTGRPALLTFEGHYHMSDAAATPRPRPRRSGGRSPPAGVAGSTPVPEFWGEVHLAPYNSRDAVERILRRHGRRLAAVILEPVMCNAGVIPPQEDFLPFLREATEERDIPLIFDEVFTGFRVAAGGAQEVYGVRPDLSCWSKAMSGGMPVAAISGRADLMDQLGPGGLPYGGTFVAHSLSLAGTLASLDLVRAGGAELYRRLEALTSQAVRGLQEIARDSGIPLLVQHATGAFQFYFTPRTRLLDYREATTVDLGSFRAAQRAFLDRGVFFHPDNFESLVLSTVHRRTDVERFLEVAQEVLPDGRGKTGTSP